MRFSPPSYALALTATAAAILFASPAAAGIGGPKIIPMHSWKLDAAVVKDQVIMDAYTEHLEKAFDEHLSESEVKSQFSQADINGDGYVDLEEYHAVDYKNDDASVVPPSESSEEKNKLDLGRVEVEKSHEEFNLIDLNKNGKIDLKEFSTYMSKMVNQHRQNFHEDVHTSYVHSEL